MYAYLIAILGETIILFHYDLLITLCYLLFFPSQLFSGKVVVTCKFLVYHENTSSKLCSLSLIKKFGWSYFIFWGKSINIYNIFVIQDHYGNLITATRGALWDLHAIFTENQSGMNRMSQEFLAQIEQNDKQSCPAA